MTTQPSDPARQFKDRMTIHFQANIEAAAKKVFGQSPRWFARPCVSSTGKLYTLLCLGVETQGGGCDEWASVDRRGQVHWHKATKNEGWVPISGDTPEATIANAKVNT